MKTTSQLSLKDGLADSLSTLMLHMLEKDENHNAGHTRSTFFKSKNIKKLKKLLTISFKTKKRYMEALTHPSFSNQYKHLEINDFEKLEFLGDSVLGLLVTEYISKNFDNLKEGDLSKLRGAIVNTDSFANMGRFLNLDKCILLGKGEVKNGGYERSSILADTFEALWAAIFLDYGHIKTSKLFFKMISRYNSYLGKEFISVGLLDSFDYKSRLQEITHKLYNLSPEYVSVSCSDSTFDVELFIGEKSVFKVKDRSKKRAEKRLAEFVLNKKLYIFEGANQC